MKLFSFATRSWITIAMITVVALAAAATWTIAKSSDTTNPTLQRLEQTSLNKETTLSPSWSKATLTISNMSCGGCIDNIKASLAPLPGIGKISVDVPSGSANIFYNPNKLGDVQQIATAITTAGYPAKIERLVAAEKVSAENALFAKRAETHIASVGRLEIPRQDFAIELAHARSRYQAIYGDKIFSQARGAQVLDRIKSQIISRLISEGVKLQEVERAGYQVSPQRVAKEMNNYLEERQLSMDQFKGNLSESGYALDYFKKKFAQRLRVQAYLQEIVLKESMDEDDRQQRYTDWLINAKSLAKVIIFDKGLEDLVNAGISSGCGGTSCSVAAK